MCFVVLERLDEKSLEKCLRKHGLKLATERSTKHLTNNNKRNRQTNPKVNKPKKSIEGKRNLEDFTLERNCRRKKRKIKPLSYTDSDSKIKPSLDSFCKESQLYSELEDSKVPLKKHVDCDNISCEAMGSSDFKVRKEEVEEQRKSEPLLKNELLSQQEDLCHQVSNVDSELEIIKVCPKSSSHGCIAPLNDQKGQIVDESVELREFEEDDSREDGEDDRHTIIFEEELSKDIDDVLELEEREVIHNKFNNSEIMNRKRQKLVKFKRKSVTDRNLAEAEGKSKDKSVEELNGEEKVSEKSTECISEESLREVCGLVKRLHELSRIILLLQRELPKFGELSADFNSLISAQQENFHKEIRRSQKTIIRCYEKMLSFYRDTSQVALEIGKRTSISVEDVVNVISLCILVEGQCDVEKSINAGKQGIFPTATPSNDLRKTISEKLLRILRKKINQKEDVPGVPKQQMLSSTHLAGYPPSHIPVPSIPLGAVNCNSEVVYRPCNTSLARPPGEGINYSPGRLVGISGASCNNPKIPANFPSRPVRMPQNRVLTLHSKDSEIRPLLQTRCNQMNRLPLGTAPRHPALPKPMNNQSANPTVHFVQPVRLIQANGYHINHANGVRPLPPVSGAAGNMAVPVLVSLPGYSLPQNLVLESSKNSSAPNRSASTLQNSVFPSVKLFRCPGGVNPLIKVTPSSEVRCPFNTDSRVPIRILDNKSSTITPLELSVKNSNPICEVLNSAGQVRQELLDPTVPQKLTMRNSRLQAGPVLGLEVEGTKLMNEPKARTVEEKTGCNKVGNLGRENSKSRVYICAQNDCKNPGVRICNGCQSIIYCSETCQVNPSKYFYLCCIEKLSKHWALKHKAECYQLKALRE